MTIEIVDKKGKPVQTRVSFTKKEWKAIPQDVKEELALLGLAETTRRIYFMLDGDLLNGRPIGEQLVERINEKRGKE